MSIKKKFLFLTVTLVCCLSLACLGWAQEARATIGGRVVDGQGALIPDAQVMVISEDTGIKQTTRTNGMETGASGS